MIIPYEQLSPDALRALVEDVVTRDGTDYGEVEVPLRTKVDQVLSQLRARDAFIVFDEATETVAIASKDQLSDS